MISNKKTRSHSISLTIVASTFALFVLWSLFIVYISYAMYKEAFYEYNNDLCVSINAQSAFIIDGDLVERFAKTLTVDDDYRAFAAKLDELKKRTQAAYLYVLVDNGVPGMYTYIYDATHAEEFPGEEFALGRNETVDEYEGADRVLATGKAYTKAEYYTGTYGELYYAYAPILNSAGKVVGFLGTDMNIAPWHERMKNYRSIVLAALIFTFATFLLIYHFVILHVLTMPMKTIIDTATRLAHGELDLQLPAHTTTRNDEIGRLARAFESVAASISGLIGDIKDILRTARDGRLDERAEMSKYEGTYHSIITGVNTTLDVMCRHLDAMPEGIAFFASQQKFLYGNKAMKEFLARHGMHSTTIGFLAKLTGPGDSAHTGEGEHAASSEGEATIQTRELSLHTRDGDVRNYSISLLRSNKSAPLMMMLSDITQLVRAKNDAETASRAKGDFLSRMSHEIRTPMNAIIGMAQIATGTDDMEKIRSCLAKIEHSSKHLLGIINDILDLSRIESGMMKLDEEDFSLTDNVDFVISMMQPRARDHNIEIRLTKSDVTHEVVRTDSLRLNQVLLNLISNAIKFSEPNSKIDISLAERRESGGEDISAFRFSVRDYGIGISKQEADRIFHPFEQADTSTTRKYGGTGLGLAISQNIVEMMGGKLELESTPNEGSTFSFSFRAHAWTQEEHPLKAQESASSGKGKRTVFDFKGKRLMIVDDIEINREIILELLSDTGILMETAENGAEAVSLFEASATGHYDAILMDIRMPVMDGNKAAKKIRALKRPDAATVTIIAMTANVMQTDVNAALAAGMNAHLGKPIELEKLLDLLQRYLMEPEQD